MEKPRAFHGNISPNDIANALIARFNHGNLKAQKFGKGTSVLVQIATHDQPSSGGQTSLTVSLHKIEDGVTVQIGKQSWLGVAASLGQTAFWTWRNPWNLISRLDDLAQDFENLQLADQVWELIEDTAYTAGASFALSDRLRRLTCEYCHTANPVGASNCVSCGAPLGPEQPITCKSCGFVISKGVVRCPNCGNPTS